jgi:hypothetical protein
MTSSSYTCNELKVLSGKVVKYIFGTTTTTTTTTTTNNNNNNNNNSMALVREPTISIERSPPVGEVSDNFC